MNRTNIEWVKNPDGTQGYTWNPITGCLNHKNGMCKGGGFPCYAYKLAHGRLKERYLANENVALCFPQNEASKHRLLDPFYPRFWPDRFPKTKLYTFRQIDKVRRKPMGIFVCDMGELFGDWLPKEWIGAVFTVIRYNPWHRFYLLTKQPQNLIKFSPFPDNCWVGATVTSNAAMTMAYYGLNGIKVSKRFISFEPLLGSIGMNDHVNIKSWVDWLIIGAQTKPYKPLNIEWVEEIVEAADKAGVPVFLKNNLVPLFLDKNQLANFKYSWAFGKTGLRQELPK